MPTPKHEVTDAKRAVVRALAGYGIPGEQIARHPEVRCALSTLHKHYREDLDEGNAAALGKIGEALYKKAMAGDTASLIFLAKVRLGWKETSRHEMTGADGGPIRTAEESPRERIERRLAGLKVVGGTDSDTEAA